MASQRERRASRIGPSGARLGGDGAALAVLRVAEAEDRRAVLRDVALLSRAEPLESLAVAVDDGETVTHLREPEVQVGDVAGELVAVQGREPRQLVDEWLDDVERIGHELRPPQPNAKDQRPAGRRVRCIALFK